MKASAKIMYGMAIFLVIMTVIYIFATSFVQDDGYLYGAEVAGITGLVLATLLLIMLGGYFHFTERRIDVLPEDWEEAEIEDGAGTYGFFSPNSIWPFMMSVAILVLGLGVIYFKYWLIAIGAVLLIWTTSALSLQYAKPAEKH